MASAEPSGNATVGPFVVHYNNKLGQGTFGSVYKATYRSNKRTLAVKKIDYTNPGNINNSFMMDMARKEIKGAMTLNGHPNVVQYFDHFDDGMAFWLGMEYCELGDLEHYLKTHQKNPDLHKKLDLMFQCVRGIAFMHSFEPPYVHRDIKLKNFLVKREGDIDTVKVTDFGVAKFIEDNFGKTMQGSAFLKSFVGTPPFMAPEFFDMDRELKYKANVDIYALGLVVQVLYLYPDEYVGKEDLIPKAVNPEHRIMQIGMYTCTAMKNGWELPEVVKTQENDIQVVKKLKNIIIEMTHPEGKKRKELWLAETELEDLLNATATATTSSDPSEPKEKVSARDLKNTLQRDAKREDSIIPNITESYITELVKNKDKDLKQGKSEECILPEVEQKIAWGTLNPADGKATEETSKESKCSSDIPPKDISDQPDEESMDVTHGAENLNYDLLLNSVSDLSEVIDKMPMPLKISPIAEVNEELGKIPPKTHSPEGNKVAKPRKEQNLGHHPKYDVSNFQEFRSLDDIMQDVERQFKAAGITKNQPSPEPDRKNKKPSTKQSPLSSDEKEDKIKKWKMTVYKNGIESVGNRRSKFEGKVEEVNTEKKPPPVRPKPKITSPTEKSKRDGKLNDKGIFDVSHIEDFTPLKDRISKLYKENG